MLGLPPSSRSLPSAHTKQGFNLVEAAIVLGIVGLVIGGIWTTAASVYSNRRVSEGMEGFLFTINAAKALLTRDSYPSTPNSGTFIGPVLNAAKAYPPGWIANNNHSVSPTGLRIEVTLGCYSPCPMLSFRFYGPGHATYASKLTAGECTNLVRRLLGSLNKRDDFLSVAITNTSTTSYSKPVDAAALSCGADTADVSFLFTP